MTQISLFKGLLLTALMLVANTIVNAADISNQNVPLGNDFLLKPIGAFRFQEGTIGDSRVAYSVGPIAISEQDSKIYIAGHSHHFAVGEFQLEEIYELGDVDSLPILRSSTPFVKISPTHLIDGSADRITGLEVLDHQLLVMTDEYYDADNNNQENLVVFNDRFNLKKSKQIGFFTLEGRSHVAGWMSKIPSPLSEQLDSIYLAGSASNIPINGRHSIGPSFFTWFPYFLENIEPTVSPILTERLVDYSISNPLHPDEYNKSGNNLLWTSESKAVYGFISPNNKYYIVIGSSGGHNSGLGYKIKQKNGRKCDGPCAYDPKDYYNYFWIYDIDDIISAKQNKIKPYDLRPSQYGVMPMFGGENLIIGADYERNSNRIYFLIDNVDTEQNSYERLPVLVIYELLSSG